MGRIEVRVDDDTKIEWKKYVKKHNGIPNVSALVRFAVAEYMAEEEEDTRLEEELLNQTAELQDRLGELDRQVAKTRGDILSEDEIVGLLNSALSTYFEPVYRADMKEQSCFETAASLELKEVSPDDE
jgi:hypothetical protein